MQSELSSVNLEFGVDLCVQQWAKEALGPPAHTHSLKALTPSDTHTGVALNTHRFLVLLLVRLKFKFMKIWKFGIVHSLNFMDNLSISTTTMLHITKIVIVHKALIKLAEY